MSLMSIHEFDYWIKETKLEGQCGTSYRPRERDKDICILKENIQKLEIKGKMLSVHQPGIEPGSVPWQGTILPLDHWCC
ncbi:hypothetical protein N665_4501s0002 [Sinapis alba]|nr:hypothetical protein N665_4501s0002 [Sinapis alba]